MNVNYFFRFKNRSYSIEFVFDTIIKNLPTSVVSRKIYAPNYGASILNIIKNIFYFSKNQGEINHITGDINYVAILLKKNITILTIHHLPEDIWFRNRLYKFLYMSFWYYIPLKRCKYVTCISQKTKNDLLLLFRIIPENIFVIYNPLRSGLKYSPKVMNLKKPIILQIGTNSNKNIPKSIEALQGICCHLRIIGKLSQPILVALEKWAIEYSNVCNLTDAEIEQEYINCDIVSFPSIQEGFGLPIIEAQAIGRPVLTSNYPPMSEIAGNGACLVDPYNAESIRLGFLNILNNADLRNSIINKGIENIKRFDAATIANEYVSLYKKVLNDI